MSGTTEMECYVHLTTMSTVLTACKTCDHRSNCSVKLAHKIILLCCLMVACNMAKRVCETSRVLICEDLVFTDCGWLTRENTNSYRWIWVGRLFLSADWEVVFTQSGRGRCGLSGKNEYGLEEEDKHNPVCIVDRHGRYGS